MTNPGRHLLVVTPTPTHPQNAGNRVRIFKLLNTIRALGYRIHVVWDNREILEAYHCVEKPDTAAMEACWDSFHEVPYRNFRQRAEYFTSKTIGLVSETLRSRIGAWWHNARAPLEDSDDPDAWYNDNLDACIGQLSHRQKFDAVLVEYAYLSRALCLFNGEPVARIIDTHDVFSNRREKWQSFDHHYGWVSFSRQAEKTALERADTVIAIQENEARFLRDLVDCRIVTVGHSVTLGPPERFNRPGRNILFLGARNPVNLTATRYFLEQVFPAVRKRVPAARFLLAGHICKDFEAGAGLQLLGEVSNLADVYRRADVVVNPPLFGTGLKIKSIEALGYARPAVFSPVAADGLEDAKNRAFLVGRDAASFAGAVADILESPELASKLSVGASEFARSYNEEQTRAVAELLDVVSQVQQ